jgi:4-methyl-5(b-hydroxyethyl)-thiazole monophosphate biosynthesis
MGKTVLVPVARGIEEMEAITIIDVLRRAGADVVVASVDDLTVKAARGIEFKADVRITECLGRDFDLIVLPGGIPGADNLKNSKDLADLLEKQAAQNKLYGAICASPAVVLHPLGLVTPGAVTCHPGFADRIEGGTVQDRNVVISGPCITSKGAGTALEFSLTLVDLLFGEKVLADVKGGLAL